MVFRCVKPRLGAHCESATLRSASASLWDSQGLTRGTPVALVRAVSARSFFAVAALSATACLPDPPTFSGNKLAGGGSAGASGAGCADSSHACERDGDIECSAGWLRACELDNAGCRAWGASSPCVGGD